MSQINICKGEMADMSYNCEHLHPLSSTISLLPLQAEISFKSVGKQSGLTLLEQAEIQYKTTTDLNHSKHF